VLIVDDDPPVLRLVERKLKARAVNILMTSRASEALAICDRQPVDLLISEYRCRRGTATGSTIGF